MVVCAVCMDGASPELIAMIRGLPANDNGDVIVEAYERLPGNHGEVIVLQTGVRESVLFELHHYPAEQTLRGPRYRVPYLAVQEHRDYVAECMHWIATAQARRSL